MEMDSGRDCRRLFDTWWPGTGFLIRGPMGYDTGSHAHIQSQSFPGREQQMQNWYRNSMCQRNESREPGRREGRTVVRNLTSVGKRKGKRLHKAYIFCFPHGVCAFLAK